MHILVIKIVVLWPLTIRPWDGHHFEEYQVEQSKTWGCITVKYLKPVHSALLKMIKSFRFLSFWLRSEISYLNHKEKSNKVWQRAYSQNKQLLVGSQNTWPLVDDCSKEAFHCAKLCEMQINTNYRIAYCKYERTWLSKPSIMIIRKKSIAQSGEKGNLRVALG